MSVRESSSPIEKTTLLGVIICIFGAIFYSYEYFLRISPSVMTAQLMEHYSINAPALGGMAAFYYYAYVPMQLPVGMLMDRVGPRRLLTFACLACVLGTYLFVCSNNLLLAYLGRFIVGFGSAFAFVGVLKLATLWLPASRFALFAGLSSALGTIGAMVGDIILTDLVNKMGWLKTMQIAAIGGLVLAVLLYLVIRDISPASQAEETSAPSANGSLSKSFQELKMILSNPQIWVAGSIGCLIYLPTTVFAEMWGVPYLQHAKHFSPENAAWGVAWLFMGFTIGAPLFGWLSDLLKTRRKLLLYAALAAAALSAILLYLNGLTVGELYFVLFLLGISYSAQSLVFAIGRELSPPDAGGTAVAVTNMIVMIGGMVLQPLVGILLDWSWRGMPKVASKLHVYTAIDYQFALSIIPFCILIGGVLTLILKETYGAQASAS